MTTLLVCCSYVNVSLHACDVGTVPRTVRKAALSLFIQKGGYSDNGDVSKIAQNKQILVTADDAVGLCSHGTGEELIIGMIPAYADDFIFNINHFTKRKDFVFKKGVDFPGRQ
jgi:hypothetical protein